MRHESNEERKQNMTYMTHVVKLHGERVASYRCYQVAYNHAYDLKKEYEDCGIDADITINGRPFEY